MDEEDDSGSDGGWGGVVGQVLGVAEKVYTAKSADKTKTAAKPAKAPLAKWIPWAIGAAVLLVVGGVALMLFRPKAA